MTLHRFRSLFALCALVIGLVPISSVAVGGVHLLHHPPVRQGALDSSPMTIQVAEHATFGTVRPVRSAGFVDMPALGAPLLQDGTPITNTATISSSTPETNSEDNRSSATTGVLQPNVDILKNGPATATVGDQVSYTLTYHNSGDADAAGVVVTDTLPSDLTFVSATPAPSSEDGQTLTWNLGTLTPGASGSISIVVQSDAAMATGSTRVNTSAISTTSIGDDPSDNRSSVSTLFRRTNLAVTKAGPATALVGDELTYTLQYTNTSTVLARGVTLRDVLPTNVTLASASPAASTTNGQTLTWNLGDVAGGAKGMISIRVTVNDDAPAMITNTTKIETTTPETQVSDNADGVSTAVLRPQIGIEKTGPSTAIVGQQFNYTLAYSNTGTVAAQSTVISDTLPDGLSFVRANPAPTSTSDQTLTWDLGTLAKDATGTIAITVRIDPMVEHDRRVTNNATISTTTPGDDPANNASSAQTNLLRTNVAITKQGPTEALVDDTLGYTLAYTNTSSVPATTVTITDTLPVGVSFASANPAPSSVDGQTLTWEVGDLPARATGTISVQATVDGNAPAALVNTTTINTTTPETNSADNSAQAPTTVRRPEVLLDKQGPATATVGDQFEYTLAYSNAGDAPAVGTLITDTLPLGLSFVSAQPEPVVQQGQTIVWDLRTLDPAASGTLRLTVQSAATLDNGTLEINTATISTSTPGDTITNNSAAATTILQRADVTIDKSGPPTVGAGDEFQYTLVYTNLGEAAALSTVITDTLPSGLQFVSSSPAATMVQGQELSWDLGTVNANASDTITVTVRAAGAATAPASVTNRAGITTTTPEMDTDNNTDSVRTAILRPNVTIEKTGPQTAVVEAPYTYTLRYRNTGDTTAAGIVIVDTLPNGLSFVAATPAPANVNGQIITWNMSSLAPDAAGTITVHVRSAASVAHDTTVINTATITTTTPGDDEGDNSARAQTTLQRTNLAISKAGPGQALVDDILTYTLQYTNTGVIDAENAIITDTLPSGMTFVSATPAPSSTDGQALTWRLTTLAPGAKATITVQAKVHANALTSLENVVHIATTTPETSLADNRAQAVTTVQRPNVTVVKTGPVTATVGDQLSYTLAYSNTGETAAQGVFLTDTLPTGLQFVSATPAPKSQNGEQVVWDLSRLDAGAQGSVTLIVRSDANLADGANLTNTGGISTTTPGDDPTDNGDTAQTVLQRANVWIKKTAPATTVMGEELTYTLDYGNDGVAAAKDVRVQDVLPDGLLFVSATPKPSQQQGQTLTWDLETLDSGTTGRITLIVRATPAIKNGDEVQNVGLTSTGTPETLLTDNRSVALTRFTSPTAVQLAYFKAERTVAGEVRVRWGTLNETNTKEFKVLRASTPDRSKAVAIATVASKGSQGGDYTVQDTQPSTDGAYYWLLEIEDGGTETPYGPAYLGTNRIYLPFIIRS